MKPWQDTRFGAMARACGEMGSFYEDCGFKHLQRLEAEGADPETLMREQEYWHELRNNLYSAEQSLAECIGIYGELEARYSTPKQSAA